MEDHLEYPSGEKPQATLVVTGIRTCLTMAAGGEGPAIGEVQEQVGDLPDAARCAGGGQGREPRGRPAARSGAGAGGRPP